MSVLQSFEGLKKKHAILLWSAVLAIGVFSNQGYSGDRGCDEGEFVRTLGFLNEFPEIGVGVFKDTDRGRIVVVVAVFDDATPWMVRHMMQVARKSPLVIPKPDEQKEDWYLITFGPHIGAALFNELATRRLYMQRESFPYVSPFPRDHTVVALVSNDFDVFYDRLGEIEGSQPVFVVMDGPNGMNLVQQMLRSGKFQNIPGGV